MPLQQATPWAPAASVWSLDGRRLPVACPPTMRLVSLLLAVDDPADRRAPSAPVYLVLLTLTDAEDRAWLYRRILAREVDDELLAEVADALALSWCGVSRWFAAALWREALASWPGIEGPLTGRGVDLGTVTPARATRYLWSTLSTWHAQDKDRGEAWRRRITVEPVAEVAARARGAARRRDNTADAAAWNAAFAQVGGRR